MTKQLETAVLGGGCFWCTEAVFKMLKGVESVLPGYAGGKGKPAYEGVSTGTTGYAEVVQIMFDPKIIMFEDLLTVFFASHDPSMPNRQGNDVGTQYRSVIFFANETQKATAEKVIAEINASSPEGKTVVTQLEPLTEFYKAEDYHVDYYANNQNQPYCELVINPKLEKVQQKFADLLKTHEQ